MTIIDTLNTRRTQFDRTDNVEYAEAIDAVAELLAACEERDLSIAKYDATESLYGERSNAAAMREARMHARKGRDRYVAALARCKGGAA